MTRKLLSVVLSACMILSCFAINGITASAANTDNSTGAANSAQYAQDTIQGGAVLHCFNWTYNNIKANLADIAAAGYTAVQTSPVQQPKDYYSGSYATMTNEWWKLYQPLGLDIAPAGTSYLGSPAQLQSLCAEADSYGIKVIVDIVSNHVANDGVDGGSFAHVNSAVDSTLQKAEYYHTDTNGVSYNTRYNVTQRHLGMPDLNTGNEYIQQRVIKLLKDCVDLGVDGFRFDTAKHIELPDDNASFASDYWPNVIGAIKDYKSDVYIYGEILGDPLINISSYSKYMSVTDDSTSSNAREAVYTSSPSASKLADYNYYKGAGDSKSVLWVESHDTYMDGSTSGLTESQITKIWSIIGARANSTSLFLARPNAQMGAVSTDTTWKSTAVAEVNKFKNFFDGASEYMASSGNIAYVERGTKGVVLVNLGTSTSINVTANQIAAGTYKDQITGNTFTVKNGKITGTIGSTGVAVVYNTDGDVQPTTAAPTTIAPTTVAPTTVNPGETITVYFTDALGWGSPKAYYWGSSSDPTWPGNDMELYETNSYNQKVYKAQIPANVDGLIFTNGTKQTENITENIADGAQWYTNGSTSTGDYGQTVYLVTLVELPEPTTAEPTTVAPTTVPEDTITVYFTDALGWGSPKVYYWGSSSDPDWPGNSMELYETNPYSQKVYKAQIPADVEGIIFSGGAYQTENITEKITDGAQWYTNGKTATGEYGQTVYSVTLVGDTEETTAAPTTVEPTTAAPTTVEPTTAAPTTEPVTTPDTGVVDRDGVLVVGDDYVLPLNAAGKTTVTGEIYLAPGQYKFRMQNNRVLMGYNTTVNDVTPKGLTYSSKYKAQTTLAATGGIYKFQFSTTANALVITKDGSGEPTARLTGELHTILKPVPGNESVAIGSMYIAPGEYKFKVINGSTVCGYNKVINDSTGSGMLSISPNFSSSMTLNATGGMYTFKLFTKNNKFSVSYVNDSEESKTDVHIAGDFNLVLDDNDGESAEATGTVTLDAGTYSFKVYNYGVVYTIGATIRDSAEKKLSTNYISPVTLNATGGIYSFTFDKNTGKLTVEKK